MKTLIFCSIIFFPIIMNGLARFNRIFRTIFNLIAIISYVVFGGISAIAIYEIIKHDVVFMTNIHAVFLNIYFLISGAYLGIYGLYQLINLMMKQLNQATK
ncbi:transposase [Bacillus sp. AFS029533]|uniref:transposase n=1 Tax=Bacillus sp. AFS029533 TaxID=2033494 RepID=UPI000BFB35E1|nr:transposase [Bacillus sp. AFS029533]PGZ93024.1 transposase [Bacillus sp. AFS029533]